MAVISKSSVRLAVLLLAGASLAACATPKPNFATRATPAAPSVGGYKVGKPYQVGGVWYVPREQPDYDEVGVASWYGQAFHMKATANGEVFDLGRVSAAHTTLPLPSLVEVTNLDNGRKLTVRVNDRGPFVGDRIIDLSQEAARRLGFERQGLARVRVRYVGRAPLLNEGAVSYAAAAQSPSAAPARPVESASATPPVRPAAPVKVASAPLPPVTGSAIGQTELWSQPAASPQPLRAFRVQAGAYSDPVRARQVADQLAGAGSAQIEPVERDGVTLYRVMLTASDDEIEAWRLRDQVAGYGFADARVVRPF